MGFGKGLGNLRCNGNRKSARGTTFRLKVEMCTVGADEAVVVLDDRVMLIVAKGFTLEFVIYRTTKRKQDDF